MPTANSGYTFEDFLKRLERSPATHMSPLYHEHRELFLHRPDMFSRAVRSVAWEKGAALIDAAHHSQPVALETRRALLARMVLHNRYVRRTGAGRPVAWRAAMRAFAEAILSHGAAVPTRMTTSTLRLLAPHRQWVAAIALLKLSQANEKMTVPMLVDAAACCTTAAAWETAMKLLHHVHAQSPNLLPDCIQSLRPLGTDATTLSSAANALLPDDKGPTREQRHILSVLNDVVASVPWETAMSNEMCVSYLTHLVASTTYTIDEKVKAITTVTQHYPWEKFIQLMAVQDESMLVSSSGVSGNDSGSTPSPMLTSVEEMKEKEIEKIPPLSLPVLREGLQLIEKSPETAVPFLAAIISKLPSAKIAARFLAEAASMYQGGTASKTVRHPLVVGALLQKCSQQGEWRIASSVLLSSSPSPLPCDVASALVLQMRDAKQVSLVVDVLQRCFVPVKTTLTEKAMEAVLACILSHNRVVSTVASFSTSEIHKAKKKTTAGEVHWLSALSWATDLVQDEMEGRILQTGTAVSVGSVDYVPPKVIPRQKHLSSRMLSLLIHICVSAGSPQGALRAMGYARTVDKTELAQSEEIRALLYCMLYNRPYEAEAIVKEVDKKYGREKSQYLERLLFSIQERKEREMNAPGN